MITDRNGNRLVRTLKQNLGCVHEESVGQLCGLLRAQGDRVVYLRAVELRQQVLNAVFFFSEFFQREVDALL